MSAPVAWELSTLHKNGYGSFNRAMPDPSKCCASVKEAGSSRPRYVQCSRPRGHGPELAYCKQHAPETVASRRLSAEAKWRGARDAEDRTAALGRFGSITIDALRMIADGHDYPQVLATAVLAQIDRKYGGRK